MNKRIILLVGLLSLTLAGCVQRAGVSYGDAPHYRSGGPPPHAPAHGYRHKLDRHDMVYDSRLRAYVLLGYRDHYYSGGNYYRYQDRQWQTSPRLDARDWNRADYYRMPEGLRDSKRYDPKKRVPPGRGHDQSRR